MRVSKRSHECERSTQECVRHGECVRHIRQECVRQIMMEA